jgi:hypothetical protein
MILMAYHCKEQHLQHYALLLGVLLHWRNVYGESKAGTQLLRQDHHALGLLPPLYYVL